MGRGGCGLGWFFYINGNPDEECRGFMHRDHWYKSGYRWYKKPE